MLQCFISHCSNDLETIIRPLDKILSENYSKEKYKIFCSSTLSNPLLPGDILGPELKERLEESSCMVCAVTDNYLRSPISLTELSSMWFTRGEKAVIPIVYCPEGEKYFQEKFISKIIYLNAMDKTKAEENAIKLVDALKENGMEPLNEKKLLDELKVFFDTSHQERSLRRYIGSGESFENINLFCEDHGITQISSGIVDHDAIKKQLAKCSDIYLVMTTGSSFIDTYTKEFLQQQIAQGTSLYMILPNRNSDFCRDVAFIESPDDSKSNLERLSREFDTVVAKLKMTVEEAKKLATKQEDLGHVYLCAAYNLLRQTICLGKDEEGHCWGWVTTTMPPVRASGNTPTMVFEGNLNDEQFLGRSVYRHITEMIETARKRNGFIDLAYNLSFSQFDEDDIVDVGERLEIEKGWNRKYESARAYMEKRVKLRNDVLIEIAAQHPLVKGGPGEEFAARLDDGFRLYEELRRLGKNVKIYVPGSIHMDKGIVDPISLSEAGCTYLRSLGVPKEDLFGDEKNREYMGGYGVYNSCDECFVSAKIFNDELFGELHCICSPKQVLRKQLFYLNFQVIPVIHTVYCHNMYHRFTDELFGSVPNVLYRYQNWSDPQSPIFRRSREERMPGYAETGKK